MKALKSTLPLFVPVVAIGAFLAAGDAQALEKERYFYTNPTGICQAALPAFEGVIRKRPLAVQNEGATNAFITCSFTSQDLIKKVQVFFSSIDGATHNVSCTGVLGTHDQFYTQYVAKAVVVPGTGDKQEMTWLASNFSSYLPPPQPPFIFFPNPEFSISCELPPGVGINNSIMTFSEDVGP